MVEEKTPKCKWKNISIKVILICSKPLLFFEEKEKYLLYLTCNQPSFKNLRGKFFISIHSE